MNNYYKNLIDKEIKYLIEEKENLVEEITNIATYFEKDINLTRLDIEAINDKRQEIKAIYDLIEDLNKLGVN